MVDKVTELADWWGSQWHQTSHEEFMRSRPYHSVETTKYIAQVLNEIYAYDGVHISPEHITGIQRIGSSLLVKVNYEGSYQIPLKIFERAEPLQAAHDYGKNLYKQELREQEQDLERKLAHIKNILKEME